MSFQQILAVANQALGTRYVWGGNDLLRGVDCSGFVKQVYAAIGIELPRVSNQQARAGTPVSAEAAQPGDLVWWDLNDRNQGADHIGIYLGNGMVMEASSSQGKVVVRKLWGKPNFTRPNGAPPEGFAAGQAVPAATVNMLEQLIDLNDPGETEATVGAQNLARLTIERLGSVTEDISQIEPEQPTEPEPAFEAEDYSLREGLGEGEQEVTQVQVFRQQEGF